MSDSTERDQWVPEFEGQRPPFEPGNQVGVQFEPGNEVSVRHGAYSPRVIDPLAETFVDLLLGDPTVGYAHAPSFRPAVWAWARAEAQVQVLTEHLGETVGDLNDEAVRSAYLLLHRAESRAQTGRARLGLDPLSRARLGKDVAQGQAAGDMAALMAQLEKRDRENAEREAGQS